MAYEQPSITFFGRLHVQFLFLKIVLTSVSSHVHVDASIIILSMSVASIVNQSLNVKSNGISPLTVDAPFGNNINALIIGATIGSSGIYDDSVGSSHTNYLLESFSNFMDLIHHVSIVDDVDNSMCMSSSGFDSIGLFLMFLCQTLIMSLTKATI